MDTTLTKNRIIVVNAKPDESRALSVALDKPTNLVVITNSLEDAFDRLDKEVFDLAILVGFSIESAATAVKQCKFSFPWLETCVILDSDDGSEVHHVVQAGAYDCLTAHVGEPELSLRLAKALEHNRIKGELSQLRQRIAMSYGFDNIVGLSKPMQKLKETIRRIAPTDITVMLTGPIGTGKELAARVIHHHSNRRNETFGVVDCSSIPEELFEAELFGASSDNGAGGQRGRGLLWETDGGTLFFDDVDRMPLEVQPRLQRFLQDYTVRDARTGETRKVDVRIISATSKELSELMDTNTMITELFYQLSVLPIKVPSLMQRVEDIEVLADYFLRKIAHESGQHSYTITRLALDRLINHNWPGNVRELENTLKRATTLCRENTIEAEDVIFIISSRASSEVVEPRGKLILKSAPTTGRMDEGQRSIIIKALTDNDWNFTQTAQDLGIGRTTLWRKVKKYNLKRDDYAEENSRQLEEVYDG